MELDAESVLDGKSGRKPATAKAKTSDLCKTIISQLKQLLLKINSCPNLNTLDGRIDEIITILHSFVQHDLSIHDSDQDLNDHSRIIGSLYQIIIWLFACGNKVLLLRQILSLLVTWTDKSPQFRCSLVSSGFLLHHCLHLKILEHCQINQGLMAVVKLSIFIITNCALEINHRIYLDQIEWKEVLAHWLSHAEEGINLNAKILFAYLAPAIDCSKHELFSMTKGQTEILVGLLGAASNSPSLSAAGLGTMFSAIELVETLICLCFYSPNLSAFANAELMPTIVSLLVHHQLLLSKAVMRLLWVLLGDHVFQAHCNPFMDDTMEMCSAFSEGEHELQFLMYLLQHALNNEGSSGFSVLYSLPIKDWYFLSDCFGSVVPMSKAGVGTGHIKRVVFAMWIRSVGLQSRKCKAFWHILMENCNTHQELEQKFELVKTGNIFKAASGAVVESCLIGHDQVTNDSIPPKPAFQSLEKDFVCCHHDSVDMTRKQMFTGMKVMYSMCLSYNVDNRFETLSEQLSLWSKLWHYVELSNNLISNEMVKGIIDDLIESDLKLYSVYKLLSILNNAVKTGKATKEQINWLQQCTDLICVWILSSEDMCRHLTGTGLLLNHCEYLLMWSQENCTELSIRFLQKNTQILLNCCWEKDFQYYGNAFAWLSMLPKLYESDIGDGHIQIAVKLISANLSYILPDSSQFLWKLQKSDVILLVDLFKQAYFKEMPDGNVQFSTLHIILGFQQMIHSHRENLDRIMVEIWMLLNWAVEVLANGTMQERESMAVLLCLLLRSPTAKETLLHSTDQFFLHSLHKAATSPSNKTLRGLLNCFVCAVKDDSQLDCDDYEKCCENSYSYGMYSECISWYQKLESASKRNDSEVLLRFKVFKAKALFHIYKREQLKIKANGLCIGKEFAHLHKQCYSKTKEVISILGRAFDQGYLVNDDEGLYMLDISMMDYIYATNKLNDLRRCYLCQRSLYFPQNKADIRELRSSVCGVSQPDPNHASAVAKLPNKPNLIHSHLIPKSFLDRFTQAIPAPKNLKVFGSTHTGTLLEVNKGKLYSPKPLGRDMCCWNCEELLSSRGESPFMKNFFDRIYNPTDSQSPKQELFIEYGPWLYHFCAGLIFRNILLPPFVFLNEKEIYNLLRAFRKCILDLDSVKDEECPEIYVLTTPLSAEGKELEYGMLNYVLSATLEWHYGRYNLTSGKHDDDSFLQAHFFLLHLGMFNILVKLSPSASCMIPECFRINVKGGLYHVLPEESRRAYIPLGMWELFHEEARDSEKELFEKGNTHVKVTPSMEQTDKMKMFEIVSGRLKESAVAMQEIQPSPSPAMPKIFDLLPDGFEIKQHFVANIFKLPQNHFPIAHRRCLIEDGSEETIFVCAEQDSTSELIKPYVIWHYYKPGLEFSIGFFINPFDLSLTGVVGDSKALHTSMAKESLDATKGKIAAVLPKILLNRGILKLESLIKRMMFIRKFPNVDQKCCATGCWYCSQRCSNCFKVVGYTDDGRSTSNVKYCSETCRSVLFDMPSDLHIIICKPEETAPDNFQQRCSPLEKSHKELFHLYSSGISPNGLAYQSEFAVCSGRESGSTKFLSNLYVIHFSRNMQQQLIIEFFIDDSLQPLSALPHAEDDVTTTTVIGALKEAGAINETLSAAFENLTFEEKLLWAQESSQLKPNTNS